MVLAVEVPDHLLMGLGSVWKWRSEEYKGYVLQATALVSYKNMNGSLYARIEGCKHNI